MSPAAPNGPNPSGSMSGLSFECIPLHHARNANTVYSIDDVSMLFLVFLMTRSHAFLFGSAHIRPALFSQECGREAALPLPLGLETTINPHEIQAGRSPPPPLGGGSWERASPLARVCGLAPPQPFPQAGEGLAKQPTDRTFHARCDDWFRICRARVRRLLCGFRAPGHLR